MLVNHSYTPLPTGVGMRVGMGEGYSRTLSCLVLETLLCLQSLTSSLVLPIYNYVGRDGMRELRSVVGAHVHLHHNKLLMPDHSWPSPEYHTGVHSSVAAPSSSVHGLFLWCCRAFTYYSLASSLSLIVSCRSRSDCHPLQSGLSLFSSCTFTSATSPSHSYIL